MEELVHKFNISSKIKAPVHSRPNSSVSAGKQAWMKMPIWTLASAELQVPQETYLNTSTEVSRPLPSWRPNSIGRSRADVSTRWTSTNAMVQRLLKTVLVAVTATLVLKYQKGKQDLDLKPVQSALSEKLVQLFKVGGIQGLHVTHRWAKFCNGPHRKPALRRAQWKPFLNC